MESQGCGLQPLQRGPPLDNSGNFQGLAPLPRGVSHDSSGSFQGLQPLRRGTSFENSGGVQESVDGKTVQPQLLEGWGLQQPQLQQPQLPEGWRLQPPTLSVPSLGTGSFGTNGSPAESKSGHFAAPSLSTGHRQLSVDSVWSMGTSPGTTPGSTSFQMPMESSAGTSPTPMDVDSSSWGGSGYQTSKGFGADTSSLANGLQPPKGLGLQSVSLGVSMPSMGSFPMQTEPVSLGSPQRKDQLQFQAVSLGSPQKKDQLQFQFDVPSISAGSTFQTQTTTSESISTGSTFPTNTAAPFSTLPQRKQPLGSAESFPVQNELTSLHSEQSSRFAPEIPKSQSEILSAEAMQCSPTAFMAVPGIARANSENLSVNSKCADFGNLFKGIDLSFASGILSQPICMCCGPSGIRQGRPLGEAEYLPEIVVNKNPIDSREDSLDADLLAAFGAEGLQILFERSDAHGIERVGEGGLNHALMVALGNRLIKFTHVTPGRSEACEAQRLLREIPEMASDPHIACPLGAYRCRMNGASFPCELTMYPFHAATKTVTDIILLFECTHPPEPMRRSSPCLEYRQGTSCKHMQQICSLVKQVAGINRLFQKRYGRRHGDFKANNVLVDSQGRLVLVDLLNDSLVTCDREEFTRSLGKAHPFVSELQQYFQQACEWWSSQPEPSFSSECCDNELLDGRQQEGEPESNMDLIRSLEGLQYSTRLSEASPCIPNHH